LIAGVLLAAGGSKRYGQSKLLLPWKGKTIIRHIADEAISSRLDALYVVVGAETERIYMALATTPCQYVVNEKWKNGLSSSLKIGVRALGEQFSACMILLGDQPFVSKTLIDQLISLYLAKCLPITAPISATRRANPVLFDRIVFCDLLLTEGDKGGRDLFTKYPTAWLEWNDINLLKDIDTPQDYIEYRDQISLE
jgi:molybdenum cofactor cytidylyltransferase